jgi:hypothetical protein
MIFARQYPLLLVILLAAVASLVACRKADQTEASEAVSWMRTHKCDGQASPVWKITGFVIKHAEHIIVNILVPDAAHAKAI